MASAPIARAMIMIDALLCLIIPGVVLLAIGVVAQVTAPSMVAFDKLELSHACKPTSLKPSAI
jgi:hypothetical protein